MPEIHLTCQHCGAGLIAKPTQAGGSFKCNKCGEPVRVPIQQIPASHKTNAVRMPPILCANPFSPISQSPSELQHLVANWIQHKESNLFVLFGEFGTGKTTTLLSAKSDFSDLSIKLFAFDELVSKNEGSPDFSALDYFDADVILIDNFDAVNSLGGHQIVPPDLRLLHPLFASGKRVVLASRRKLSTVGDELLDQISRSERCEALDVAAPQVFQIVPWQLSLLQNHAATVKDERLLSITSFLAQQSEDRQRLFVRPLMVKMLSKVVESWDKSTPITVSTLYKRFCDLALASDYDAKRSQIPPATKGIVLKDLAWDIFSGDVRSHGYAVPFDRVEQRVLEHVMQANLNTQKWGHDRYQWTHDFVTTNHILETASANKDLGLVGELPEVVRKQCEFAHQSFYEYYLALALMNRILHNDPFGIDSNRLSSATFDSLTLQFIKELTPANQLSKAIKSTLASRKRLGTSDRLVLLYLLEDDPEFGAILSSLPDSYFEELEDFVPPKFGIFICKVARFQLVIAGRYTSSDYLREVKLHEDEESIRAELYLHSTGQSVTDQLVARLKNESLKAAREIFVFRLGQMGEQKAVPVLEGLALNAESKLGELAIQSIARIKERLGKDQ